MELINNNIYPIISSILFLITIIIMIIKYSKKINNNKSIHDNIVNNMNNTINEINNNYSRLKNNFVYNNVKHNNCPVCNNKIIYNYSLTINEQKYLNSKLYSEELDGTKNNTDSIINVKCNKCKNTLTIKIIPESISIKPWMPVDNNINEFYMIYNNEKHLLGAYKNNIFYPYKDNLKMFWVLYKEQKTALLKIKDLQNIEYDISEFLNIINNKENR